MLLIYLSLTNICLEFIISKLPKKRQKLISDSNSDHINLMPSSRIINIDNENTINIPSEI